MDCGYLCQCGIGDIMPKNIDSVIIKEPIKKKILTLEFEEGDNVLACIKEGLAQNGVKECDVVQVDGVLTRAVVNTFEGSKFKKIEFSNQRILRASGHFKIGGGDLWGNMNIFTEGRKPISGTVVSAIASQGFLIKFSFLP